MQRSYFSGPRAYSDGSVHHLLYYIGVGHT